VNPATDATRLARMPMFAPHALMRQPAAGKRARSGFESRLPDFFKAELLDKPSGRVPPLRVYGFNTDNDDEFIAELQRLLPLRPENGRIIDIRDDPGGNARVAARVPPITDPALCNAIGRIDVGPSLPVVPAWRNAGLP
jgi:hypothetical protein